MTSVHADCLDASTDHGDSSASIHLLDTDSDQDTGNSSSDDDCCSCLCHHCSAVLSDKKESLPQGKLTLLASRVINSPSSMQYPLIRPPQA